MTTKAFHFLRGDFSRLGSIKGAFGTKGELKVDIDAGVSEALQEQEGQFLFVDFEDSIVPFHIEYAKWGGQEEVVKFTDIKDRSQAVHLSGRDLFLPKITMDEWEVVGMSDIEDQLAIEDYDIAVVGREEIFRVVGTETLVEQFMIYLGLDDQEYMVPLVNEYVVSIDEENKRLTLDLPEGLLEL